MVTALMIIIEIMRGVSLSAVLMQRDQSHPRTVGKGQNILLSAIVGNPFTMNICIIENKKCGTNNHNNTIAIKIWISNVESEHVGKFLYYIKRYLGI